MTPCFDIPVYHWHAGRLTGIYVRQYIESAQRNFPLARRLTEAQSEAMDLVDEIANDPAVHLAMAFAPGDMQFLHNHQILHSRNDFENWHEPERHRHLLRLWVAPPGRAAAARGVRAALRQRRVPASAATASAGDHAQGAARGGIRQAARGDKRAGCARAS